MSTNQYAAFYRINPATAAKGADVVDLTELLQKSLQGKGGDRKKRAA